ncbi:hypothetical protein PHMEG_0009674 [Phytophthora megakarya]|uniref:RxLR effector protein n=1 Tax=Phytophthora megakarya TaxID=4795 RepID=A0A225WFM2_9STRA|nr:hypothetical protein PHMEG_0009674 [Phytophthora megakarya]
MGLISSIDIALDDTNNKRFLRSDREFDDEAVEDDDEERGFLAKKSPFYLKLINRLRGKKTFLVTTYPLAKQNKFYTKDIFAGWVQQGNSIETFQNMFKKLVKSKMITKEQYADSLPRL